MEPLQTVPAPTHVVLVGITSHNSWPASVPDTDRTGHGRPAGAHAEGQTLRLAYIATNSTLPLSFVSLQSSTHARDVTRVASRPSNFEDMPHGLVIELQLKHDIVDGDTVYLALAQAGASTYFPPQQIDDAR